MLNHQKYFYIYFVFLYILISCLLPVSNAMAGDKEALEYYQKGEHYFNKGKYEDALKWYQKAIEERSYDGPIQFRKEKVTSVPYGRSFKREVTYDTWSEEYYPNKRLDEVKKKSLPSDLVASVQFTDKKSMFPNKIIDAGEESQVIITVSNNGKGIAFDTAVNVDSDSKYIDFTRSFSLGDIHPGDSKDISVTLKSGLDLPASTADFAITCQEKRGYDCKRVKLSIQTAALEKPELEIKSVRINDGTSGQASGNGNGVIENGETVELQVFVENIGVGEAYDVKLSLEKVTPTGVEIVSRESELGRIGIGETARGKVVVRVPRNINISQFEAKFFAEERVRKAARIEKSMSLSSTSLSSKLALSVDWNDGTSGQASGNGNGVWETGETIEGVIRVNNKGDIAAEGVEVRLSAEGTGVEIEPKKIQVGKIGPNQSSISMRVLVKVSRIFEGKDIVVNAEVSQYDFSGIKERWVNAIELIRPDLAVSWRIADQDFNNTEVAGRVVQGDNTRLEVRVMNKGKLDARGVKLSVKSRHPDIQIEQDKEIVIGKIAVGQESEPLSVPVKVLRRTPVGEAGITVEVSQNDFSKLVHKGVLLVHAEGEEVIKVTGEAVKTIRPIISAAVVTSPPVIIRSTPPSGGVMQDRFELVWEEVREVLTVMVRVNEEAVPLQETSVRDERGIGLNVRDHKSDTKLRRVMVPLRPGENMIVVTGYDFNNRSFEDRIAVIRKSTEIGKNWALLIGINEYDNWPKLTTAMNDVNGLRGVLGERYGFSPDRIKAVTNHAATREGIIDAFQWLIDNTADNDNVFIYYAGHGELDRVSGYWVPVEAKRDKKSYYISNSTIRDYIGAVKAKHVYLVTDSCFSGSLFASATRSQPPVISERYYQEIYTRKSRQALTSGGTEPVSDAGYDNHSIFAYYFIKTLRENNERYITATEIFSKIAPPVANNSKQTPIGQPIKDVQDEGGEFIFAIDGQLP